MVLVDLTTRGTFLSQDSLAQPDLQDKQDRRSRVLREQLVQRAEVVRQEAQGQLVNRVPREVQGHRGIRDPSGRVEQRVQRDQSEIRVQRE